MRDSRGLARARFASRAERAKVPRIVLNFILCIPTIGQSFFLKEFEVCRMKEMLGR